MKTKSIAYARVNGIALLLSFLAAVPVSSQEKYVTRSNHSLSPRDRSFAANFLTLFAASESYAIGNTGSIPLPSSLPARDNTASGTSGLIKRPDGINSLPVKMESRFDVATGKISFKRTSFTYPVGQGKDIGVAHYPAEQLLLYATSLKQYAKKNGLDTTYAFFSNMGMLTNIKRFFVVNLVTMEIVESGLVAHGRGMGASRFDKQYSNKKDSKCTSLGRYKISRKYKGEYGNAYKLIGLDSSNCNAYKRNIVLHAMGCMPDKEGHMPVCISEGCPAVSERFLKLLSKIIDTRKKPVLLWIFDSNLEEAIVEQKIKEHNAAMVEERKYHRCAIHQPVSSGSVY